MVRGELGWVQGAVYLSLIRLSVRTKTHEAWCGLSGADLLPVPQGPSAAAPCLLQLVRENTDPAGPSGDAASEKGKVSQPCWSPSARTEPLHRPARLACWVWILLFPRKGTAKASRAAFFLFNIKQWQLVTSGSCSVSKGLTPGRGGGWLFCRRPGCPWVV